MRRSDGRILTTHVGSLPRPPALTQLYARRQQGEKVDEAALAEAARAATRWSIGQQVAAGIDVGNNGEQTREAFFLYVRDRLTGFGGQWQRPPHADLPKYPLYQKMRAAYVAGRVAVTNLNPPTAIGPIRYIDPRAIEAECDDFAAALRERQTGFVEPFLTAPSPGIVAAAMRNDHYDSMRAYLTALADALRVEYEAAVRHGFVLQLDCPDLAMERHMLFADRPLSEFIGFVEDVIEAINRGLANVPREMVRLHVCWGNYEGPHDCDVPLSDILKPILKAKVGGFSLPFANPRHQHETGCFNGKILADDQLLIAGVIDTTTNYIEHPEVVAERLERCARALGDPARVIASTDCGFDTSAGMGRVAEDVVWAKLRAMADGAALASKQLF
ncbi:MAG: hypothetical protein FJX68_18610 [Alphaproteobacteria bacterium]|nr:hypothetical protein [Alphaproteobacteria bacterium]